MKVPCCREKRAGHRGRGLVAVVLAVGTIFWIALSVNPGGDGAGIGAFAATSPSGFDPERLWSPNDDWEPVVATDPITADVYQLTTRLVGPPACGNCSQAAIIFRRSADGGGTWGPDQFLSVSTNFQGDPQIAVSRSGTIYATWVEFYSTFDDTLMFTKSSDHGATWTPPLAVDKKGGQVKGSDHPALVVSADGVNIYVAFSSFTQNANSNRVAASHDGGNSFLPSVQTNSDGRIDRNSAGAIAANGTVYFTAADFASTYLGEGHVDVLKSVDGGASWATARLDTSQEMPDCPWALNCSRPFLGSFSTLTIDASGTLMIAYTANNVADAPEQIYIRTSTDGVSWSARQQVSSSLLTVNNVAPTLAAGTTAGDFRLVFQDDRNGSQIAWNTWFRRTTNGGGKWTSPVRLSDAASGASYKTAAGYTFPYGDYLGLAVDALGMNHTIWGEGTGIGIRVPTGGGTWFTRGQ